jgi:phage-related minor tail protein
MLVAACGSSGSTAARTSTAKPASAAAGASATPSAKVNCANVNSLRRSLESLSHTSVSPSSAATLTTDLKNVQKQLVALKGQGGGHFTAMTGDLTASVNQIQQAAGQLATNPTSATKQLTTALAALKTKIPPAIKELNAACPK